MCLRLRPSLYCLPGIAVGFASDCGGTWREVKSRKDEKGSRGWWSSLSEEKGDCRKEGCTTPRKPRRRMRSRALIYRVTFTHVTRRVALQKSALQRNAAWRRIDVIEAFIMIMGEDKIRSSICGDPRREYGVATNKNAGKEVHRNKHIMFGRDLLCGLLVAFHYRGGKESK